MKNIILFGALATFCGLCFASDSCRKDNAANQKLVSKKKPENCSAGRYHSGGTARDVVDAMCNGQRQPACEVFDPWAGAEKKKASESSEPADNKNSG